MIVKIEDIGFNNKGAALMLYAILDKLKEKYGKELIIVVDDMVGNRLQKANLNLFQEASFQRFKIKNLIPTSQLLKYSLVNPKDINLILNASGFYLGDQWLPMDKVLKVERIKKYKFYKKHGAKIVYLPQAYGPFTEVEMIKYIRSIEKYVDLFFVRDQISLESLKKTLQNKDLALLYPDFTNIYEVAQYRKEELKKKSVIIIPNFKMFYETDLSESDYIDFLSDTAARINKDGYEIVLLNHEGKLDMMIINKIIQKLKFEVKVYSDLPPDKIKYIIKGAYAVITSRFHGAVSSLSQGVPVLVTSWSHKDQELLRDYSLEENLFNCLKPEKEIQNCLFRILDPFENMRMREKIIQNAEEQKKLTSEMWNFVFQKIQEKK